MIAGTQLAERRMEKTTPLPLACNDNQIAWHEVGSPARIIALLRTSIKSHVPVGYEDESGFHYGVDVMNCFFNLRPAAQTVF
jgi:hypothetical protein